MTSNNQVQPILSVRNLKSYFPTDEGVVKAVDGASFDVLPGQTVGIVGESGCGKSTVGRSILQILDKPGRVMDGEMLFRTEQNGTEELVDLAKLPPNGKMARSIRGREISLIFQEPMTSLSPVHPIDNQIMEVIRLHTGVSKEEARNRGIELLRDVGVANPEVRIREYPHQLSGGLRQRAIIAMALSCNPKLLIADEPTTALDVTTQAQILDLLRGLQEQHGMAIIFITHNLGVIAEMADTVTVMYLGRVVENGTIDEIFHSPKHPYTQALLRSIPSVHSQSREILPSITGNIPHPFLRPRGCPFHPRCEFFMQGVCDEITPELITVADTQDASCLLYDDRVTKPEGVSA